MTADLRLWKYEGAGNDFLVWFDLEGTRPVTDDEVRALCDRHHGVGADGLLRVLTGDGSADVRMELRNADGSPAEMSGNGVRCLAHAVVDRGLVAGDEVVVATDAGLRPVTIHRAADGVSADGQVAMGMPGLGPEPAPEELAVPGGPQGPGVRLRRVDAGNPHLVVVVPAIEEALVRGWAAAVDAATPGGTNVELVEVVDRHRMVLAVWERGAGVTLACGTGTCAAAVAAADWDLVDLPVTVANPGGPLTVADDGGGGLLLAGPSRRVAEVLVPAAALAAGSGSRGGGWHPVGTA